MSDHCARSRYMLGHPSARAPDVGENRREVRPLGAERALARSVKQRVRFQAPVKWSPVGRCATPGLRAHPPPDPSDICKWRRR
jgi:hypothetical protein